MVENTTIETAAAPTIDDRLAAAESEIGALKGEVSQWKDITAQLRVVVAVMFCVGAVLVGTVIWNWFVPGRQGGQPANPDASVEQLLRQGVHCYGSAQERAVARQRALEAIERIEWAGKWDSSHPPAGGYPIGAPGPVPVKAPVVRDIPPVGASSWDAATCFEID